MMSKVIVRTIIVDRYIYTRQKRRCNFIYVFLFMLSYGAYLRYTFGPNFSFPDWNDDISCYLNKEDNLSSITDFNPSGRSIFFNDPACNVNLFKPKEACVIESAARANLNFPVYILFNSPISNEDLEANDVLKVLLKIPNIHLARVNIEEYAMGTPAEGFVLSGGLNNTKCPTMVTEGLVKYLTLYKWGGIFIQKDFILTNSLSSLSSNWVTKQNDGSINPGILALSKTNRHISESALRLLLRTHKSVDCIFGENIMAQIVEQECSTANPFTNSAASCNGFEIYGPQLFYNIESQQLLEYLESGELPGLHRYTNLLNKLTVSPNLLRQIGSRYSYLAREHCPEIHSAFTFNF